VIATSSSISAGFGVVGSRIWSRQLTHGEPLAHGDERRLGKTAKLIDLHARLNFRSDRPRSHQSNSDIRLFDRRESAPVDGMRRANA
jgi:hypothetical protein